MPFHSKSRTGPSPALVSARTQLDAMRSRFAMVRRAAGSSKVGEGIAFGEAVGGGALGGFLDAKFSDKLTIGPAGPSAVVGLALGLLAFVAPKAFRCHLLNTGSGALAYAVGDMVNKAAT